MKQKLTLIMFVFLTTIACGTVMLPIDSLIHWGDVGYTASVVNQYLVWEIVAALLRHRRWMLPSSTWIPLWLPEPPMRWVPCWRPHEP
jgi:hypothetical protein